MPGTDIADNPFAGVLDDDQPVGGDNAPVPVHLRKKTSGKPGRFIPRMIGSIVPGPAESTDLTCDRKRHRDLLTLPGGEFAFDPPGRLDRYLPFSHIENPPELALGDEDYTGVY